MIPNSRAIISRIYFHKLYTIDQTKSSVRSGFDSRRKIGKKKNKFMQIIFSSVVSSFLWLSRKMACSQQELSTHIVTTDIGRGDHVRRR